MSREVFYAGLPGRPFAGPSPVCFSGDVVIVEEHGPNESLEQLKKRIAELEELVKQSNSASGSKPTQAEAPVDITPISEGEMTLRRLVQRIAMILQAEKIVIMFYDREIGELRGIPPAFGVDDEHLNLFRIRATHGISGQVFRDGEPILFHDAANDPRADKDPFALLHVVNGICVPLVIEKRDEENRVIERSMIGVLHSFNKRHGEDFNDEDVRLLERMAKNVGSIIANLQMYREVVEEREELLQTLESLSAGLVLIGSEGRISQMNSSCRAIFGLATSPVGKPYPDLIPNPEIKEMVLRGANGQDVGTAEITVHLHGNDRIYQVNGAQVKHEDGKDLGVVLILNDVTDLKNIEKMKSSFVAMASHELRTPLTAIKGFSSTLLEGIDDDLYTKEDQKEFLNIVVNECDRLRRLIDDLLNTSRIEAGESLKPSYGEVKIRQLLDKVQKIQQQATNRHVIKLSAPDTMPIIVGDEDKLDQTLTNLLNNAIKYSPNGGDITIHAKVEDETDTILLGVQDQGMGIPAEHVDKVFERFHRVDNEDNRKIYGTGLGLFLVKHLVEDIHDGQIWCESEVGVGSTFWVRLPQKLDIEKMEANLG
ncbi:MAG TPA: ATP-binding protein [Fimbriimonadaceae bacterium]|nr:ATP-binding protein [Fimbriimonadaceae bacterium]HRJ33339.1 ATP-binding protein [Fimbriimonadaceae bacterium]